MRRTNGGTRVGGSWLAIASSLIIATLALHGPIAPDLSEQMRRIADGSATWAVAHWIAAGEDGPSYGGPRGLPTGVTEPQFH